MESPSSSYVTDFCQAQQDDDWSLLPTSTQAFLKALDLPKVHPFCTNNVVLEYSIFPAAPSIGPAPGMDVSYSDIGFAMNMIWAYFAHPLVALIQIWTYLLAGYIAPVGLACMVWWRYQSHDADDKKLPTPPPPRKYRMVHAVTLVLSWIVLADDQYVLEFGRVYGFLLVAGTIMLTTQHCLKNTVTIMFLLLIVLPPWMLQDPDMMPLIPGGIYSNPNNPKIAAILKDWQIPDYSSVATPWQLTGDARTGLPYLLNQLENPPNFHRVWMETEDHEYIALDIAFPDSGHDPSQPLYFVLHGLNGGSEEGYVADLAASRTQQGSTVVVMVARGLMDTPILGWTFFHGVRISDAHIAASTLRDRVLASNQTLAAVGYSLGAIVLNHYVAAYEDKVALDVSVSISGALYCIPQKDFMRSKRTWQVLIAAFMKETFLAGKWGARLYHQLGVENYKRLLLAPDIVDIDQYAGVLYNGYDSITHFYQDMSAIDPDNMSKPHHFAIPHLILQSVDDPVSTWRSNADNDPNSYFYPTNLVRNQENLVVILTDKGGHVGWPIGMSPHSWEYMNEMVAAGFIDAFQNVKAFKNETIRGTCGTTAVWSQENGGSANTTMSTQLLEPTRFQSDTLRSVVYGSGQ